VERTASSPYVCTEGFKADLSSFFINQNSKAVVAQDESELCELCGKIIRLAHIYSNDITSQHGWDDALNNNACGYAESKRIGDCNRMVSEVIRTQRDYFHSSESKLTEDEWSKSTEELGVILDAKSFAICKQISCCPRASKRSPPIAPVKYVDDNDKDRQSIEDDLTMLKKAKELVLSVRYENQKLKEQVWAKEADLVTREKKLQAGKDKLAADQATLKGEQKELTARVATQTQLEADFQKQVKEREALDDAREQRIATLETTLSKKEESISKSTETSATTTKTS